MQEPEVVTAKLSQQLVTTGDCLERKQMTLKILGNLAKVEELRVLVLKSLRQIQNRGGNFFDDEALQVDMLVALIRVSDYQLPTADLLAYVDKRVDRGLQLLEKLVLSGRGERVLEDRLLCNLSRLLLGFTAPATFWEVSTSRSSPSSKMRSVQRSLTKVLGQVLSTSLLKSFCDVVHDLVLADVDLERWVCRRPLTADQQRAMIALLKFAVNLHTFAQEADCYAQHLATEVRFVDRILLPFLLKSAEFVPRSAAGADADADADADGGGPPSPFKQAGGGVAGGVTDATAGARDRPGDCEAAPGVLFAAAVGLAMRALVFSSFRAPPRVRRALRSQAPRLTRGLLRGRRFLRRNPEPFALLLLVNVNLDAFAGDGGDGGGGGAAAGGDGAGDAALLEEAMAVFRDMQVGPNHHHPPLSLSPTHTDLPLHRTVCCQCARWRDPPLPHNGTFKTGTHQNLHSLHRSFPHNTFITHP
jgi:hypothetical protein